MFKKIKDFLLKNTSSRQTIAKNTLWLSISNFGGRAIKAAIIIYAARVLGTADYGVFSYAVTLAGFLGLFLDPGINGVLMRDTAGASDEKRRKVFSTTFFMKLILLVIGIFIVIFIAPFFSTLPGAKALLPIVAFILVFDASREFLLSLLRGLEQMEWDAVVFILTNIGIVIFGFIFLALHPTVASLSWGYAIGTGLGVIAALVVVRDYFKDIFKHFSSELVKPILASAWPFAAANALGLLLTNTDILIISWMRSASDVGVYAAAIRIIQVLYLIPGVLQFSSLPLLARLAKNDNGKFRTALEGMIGVLFIVSIPLAIGSAIIGTEFMSFVYGPAYAAGGASLAFLMATMIVDFPGSILGAALFAYGSQKKLIIAAAIGGISNVVFDLALIPRFGIVGSASATLLAQILCNGYLWYAMKKVNYFAVVPKLKNIAVAAVIMAAVTAVSLWLNVNVLINIFISTIVYFAALKLLREPMLEEMLEILPGGRRLMSANTP
jgi:O-antigen/teichoic acid export membrane protein